MTGLAGPFGRGVQQGAVFAGDFLIERRLGEGGMGAVYIALQRSTGRKRALKLMQPSLVENEKLKERFLREARVGSRFESDHVVQVIGAGVDPQTQLPWLAMELLEGEDLATMATRRGALPRGEVLEILSQIAEGLGAAHGAGVVHRDMKPENVFISNAKRANVRHVVKILDFGIARVAAEANTKNTDAMGSPLWMAPEQAQRGDQVSARTDVWALGLIAFTLLTGRKFWMSANDEDASALKVMREVLFEPIPTASARAAALEVGHTLPTGFDEWFARTVAREPADRLPDATEAFAALQPILAGEGEARPSVAKPPLAMGGPSHLASSSASTSGWPSPLTSSAVGSESTLPATPAALVSPLTPATRALASQARPRWPLAVFVGTLAVAGAAALTVATGGRGAQPLDSPTSLRANQIASVNASVALTTAPPPPPEAQARYEPFAQVVGVGHRCALRGDGRVLCWGSNFHGQAGVGTKTDVPAPKLLDSIGDVTGLASGPEHVCARTRHGRVYCWGRGFGLEPAEVLSGNVDNLVAAGDQTCARATDGSVICWLADSGNATGSARKKPPGALLDVGASEIASLSGIQQLASPSCGIKDGRVLCARYRGAGATKDRDPPETIAGLEGVVQMVDTGSHACARTQDGAVYCWGDNDRGAVGAEPTINVPTPRRVPNVRAKHIAAGAQSTCATLYDDTIYCWGNLIHLNMPRGSNPLLFSKPENTVEVMPDIACARLMSGAIQCNEEGIWRTINRLPAL